MARLARNVGTKPTASFTGFSSGLQWGSAFKGARASWIYMRPTELNPFGEHIFMIDDKVFGYVSGQDTNGRKLALHHGELPLYPVYYTKKPHDWWPHGFCGNLVAPQREVNRQVTAILESAIINRGLLGYNTDLVSKDDILNAPSGLVPFRSPGYEDRGSPPLIGVSTTQVSRDVGAVLSIFQDAAKQAAGYESGIIVGQSEGRVEGGPATSILNTNAQAPLQPVLDRKRMAYGRLFQDALGLIREVWPPEKRIRVIGPQNLGRELLVLRDKIPNADEVVLTPTPMVANGRGGMFNMLLALRTQPTENGEPPIVRTYEVRRALHLLDLAPPGLDLFDEAERRILWRIGNLINDGQAPAIAPAGSSPLDMQAMENHVLAVDLLKRAILHPSFMLYSPDVQRALRMELEFHSGRLPGMAAGMVDSFDDPMLRTETRQAEDALEAMENDPTSLAGLFAPGGVI